MSGLSPRTGEVSPVHIVVAVALGLMVVGAIMYAFGIEYFTEHLPTAVMVYIDTGMSILP